MTTSRRANAETFREDQVSMHDQRILFAETTRVFKKLWKLVLLMFGIQFFVLVAMGLSNSNEFPSILSTFNEQSQSNAQAALAYIAGKVFFWPAIILMLATCWEHFGPVGKNRKDWLTRSLYFVLGMLAFAQIDNWIDDVVLDPFKEILNSTIVAKSLWPELNSIVGWGSETIIFCLLGTWLAAAISKRDLSLEATLQRGCRQFTWTMTRFLLGPGLFMLFNIASVRIFEYAAGIPVILEIDSAGAATHIAAYGFFGILGSIKLLVGHYSKVMMAVILAQALMRDEKMARALPRTHTVPA